MLQVIASPGAIKIGLVHWIESAPKRTRAGGGSAGDRLSALPDDLLHHVLSLVLAKQDVQTPCCPSGGRVCGARCPASISTSTMSRTAPWRRGGERCVLLGLRLIAFQMLIDWCWLPSVGPASAGLRIFSNSAIWALVTSRIWSLLMCPCTVHSHKHSSSVLIAQSPGRFVSCRMLQSVWSESDGIQSDELKTLVVRYCSAPMLVYQGFFPCFPMPEHALWHLRECR